MSLQGSKTKELYQRASKVIPHGVNSNFRYWGTEDTLVIKKGKGAYIWDMDDKQYIDYRLAFGPVILGHAEERVTQCVKDAIEGGTLFAWTTELEISVAERVCRMTGIDKVRLTNTGTEATMHTLRVARAYTGREKYIKFEGAYHGQNDYFMWSTASSPLQSLGGRRSPVPAAATGGMPRGISEYVITVPFNNVEMLEHTFATHGHEAAAMFVEPMLGNVAGLMPQPGYLEKVRELCTKYGVVLVFDEVKTGFRLANGGAQEYFGVKADMVTFAKSMGNSYPVAALGGKDEIMMTIAPGEVAHGGTYSGNIPGAAAADATLEILETEPVIEEIFKNGQALMDGIDDILTEADIPHAMTGVPSMFCYVLGTDQAPPDFRSFRKTDEAFYEKVGLALIRHGVMPDADGREPWFTCRAHDDKVVAETLEHFKDAIYEVKGK